MQKRFKQSTFTLTFIKLPVALVPAKTHLNIESGGPAVTSTANSYAFWERTTSPSAPCRIVRREPAADGGRKRRCMLGLCKHELPHMVASAQPGCRGKAPGYRGPRVQ